uniref:Uncharacterized protein n=1 Tax=Schistosoma haematobium TaxID=6185 RepID=A0A095BWW8_SCHHA
MLMSEPFRSELYNNTLAICDKLPKLSIMCNALLHDIFMAITLSFSEQFVVYRLCKTILMNACVYQQPSNCLSMDKIIFEVLITFDSREMPDTKIPETIKAVNKSH